MKIYYAIVIAPSRWNALDRFSQFVRSFLCEVTVGVGGSDERDQSSPTQTAPQQVGFGSDRDYGVNKVSRPTTMMVWDEATHQVRANQVYTTYLVPGAWYLTHVIYRRMLHTICCIIHWRVYRCYLPGTF